MRPGAFIAASLIPSLFLTSAAYAAQRRTKMAAWRSRAENQADLVRDLVDADLLRSPEVISAFQRVDRGWFLPASPGQDIADTSKRWVATEDAYFDTPQPIGHRVTISAPHMHAMMAELLYRSVPDGLAGKSVLDVGSGSGYLTAVLGLLTGRGGRVVGVEHVPELVETSSATLRRFMPELDGIVQFERGDGRAYGSSSESSDGQFDLIHVGAATEKIPRNLVELLRPRGRMVLPVGPPGEQELIVVDKQPDGTITAKKEGDVMFVPLTALDSQLRRG